MYYDQVLEMSHESRDTTPTYLWKRPSQNQETNYLKALDAIGMLQMPIHASVFNNIILTLDRDFHLPLPLLLSHHNTHTSFCGIFCFYIPISHNTFAGFQWWNVIITRKFHAALFKQIKAFSCIQIVFLTAVLFPVLGKCLGQWGKTLRSMVLSAGS